MRRLLTIARHEYGRFARRKGFLLGTLALPLAVVALVGVGILISLAGPRDDGVIGYVDNAGILATSLQAPPTGAAPGREDTSADHLGTDTGGTNGITAGESTGERAFAHLEDALSALESGGVEVVYVVPPSFLEDGGLTSYFISSPPSADLDGRFRTLLRQALVSGLPENARTRLLDGPAEVIATNPEGERSRGLDPGRLFIPIAVGIFFTFAVMGTSGYLLQAVTDEKENRTVEVVTTSVSPEQLIGGKALGLIGLALTQIAVWVGFAVVALLIGGRFLEPLHSVDLPLSFIALAATFFVPSFVLAAGMVISIGASVPDFRQGQQISGLTNFLFLLPLFFLGLVFTAPDSPVLVVLSLFPTTSLLTLSFRAGVTALPFWQVAVAFVLLLFSALGALLLAPRIFRLGMLTYGRRLDRRTLRAAFRASPTRGKGAGT